MAQAPHNLVLRYVRRIAGTVGGGDVADADLLARFLDRRDEAAFELLMWRHGTMVLQVCRDVTRDEHAAEDAFQATFLALLCKAAAIRSRASLGAWLYQVAYRASLRARRGGRETVGVDLAEVSAAAELPDDAALRDLRPVLHEEVQRLPARYRDPIVLCYLEGLTHEQAALQLGWPRGTVAGRVARARAMLRKRLTRRGVALSVGLAALTLAPASAYAIVPAALVQATLRAGLLFAAGQSAAGVISAHVIALTEGVLRAMLWNKVKLAATIVLALSLVGSGVGLFAGSRMTVQPDQVAAASQEDRGDDPTVKDQESPRRGNKLNEDDATALRKARRQSIENLKQIALGMHNYMDTMGYFPLSAIYGKNGKPLVSWRVALLPYLNQHNLYKQFHLDEPWDSGHNKKLLNKMPDVYRVLGQKDKNATYYQVFVGESTMFERRKAEAGGGAGGGAPGAGGGSAPQPGGAGSGGPAAGGGATGAAGGSSPATGGGAAQPGGGLARPPATGGTDVGIRIAEVLDGMSNTILVIEGGSTVPWTKPEDLPYVPTGKLPPLGGAFGDCIHAAFADGAVHTLKHRFDETAMRSAITRNGGEVFDLDDLEDPAPGTDPKELKEENDDLRRQVKQAHDQVIQLTKQLLDLKVNGAEGKPEESGEGARQLVALKREHQMLQRELENLRSEIERLKRAIEGAQGNERRVPTKKSSP